MDEAVPDRRLVGRARGVEAHRRAGLLDGVPENVEVVVEDSAAVDRLGEDAEADVAQVTDAAPGLRRGHLRVVEGDLARGLDAVRSVARVVGGVVVPGTRDGEGVLRLLAFVGEEGVGAEDHAEVDPLDVEGLHHAAWVVVAGLGVGEAGIGLVGAGTKVGHPPPARLRRGRAHHLAIGGGVDVHPRRDALAAASGDAVAPLGVHELRVEIRRLHDVDVGVHHRMAVLHRSDLPASAGSVVAPRRIA